MARGAGLRSSVGRSWSRLLGSTPPPPPRLGPRLVAWLEQAGAELDPVALQAQVEALPAPRSRLHHPEAMHQAEQLLLNGFTEAGWTTQRRPFSIKQAQGWRDYDDFAPTAYKGLSGVNLVAVKEGQAPSALVVLAHLDTVRDSPGANDNSASVVALLALARLLAPLRLHHSVLLAATDFEELGLFGTRALVPELLAERPLLGAINLETLAYTDSRPGAQRLPAGLGALYPLQVARVRERDFAADFTALIHDRGAAGLAADLRRCAGPPRRTRGAGAPTRPRRRAPRRAAAGPHRAPGAPVRPQRPRRLLGARGARRADHRHRQLPRSRLPPAHRHPRPARLPPHGPDRPRRRGHRPRRLRRTR